MEKRDKKGGNRLRVISLVLLLLIMAVSLYFINAGITGSFFGEQNLVGYSQNLDLELSGDEGIVWELDEYPEIFELKAIKLSGSYIGDGEIKVYLEHNGTRHLVLDNEAIIEEGVQLITGHAIAAEDRDEEETEEEAEEEQEEEEVGEEAEKEQETAEEQEESVEEAAEEEEETAEEAEETEQELIEEGAEEEEIEEPDPEDNETEAELPAEEENVTEEEGEETEIPLNETEEETINETIELDENLTEEVNATLNETTEETNQTLNQTTNATMNETVNATANLTTNITTNATGESGSSGGTGTVTTNRTETNATVNETEAEEIEEMNETIEEEITGPQTYHVNITYDGFEPEVLEINSGDMVVWTNVRSEKLPRTAFVQGARPQYRDIQSQELEPGESFSWTFDKAGSYQIVDGVIVTLVSRIDVEGETEVEGYEFEEVCAESCLLPSGLNLTEYNLVFEVSSGELVIDSVYYIVENLTELPVEIDFEVLDGKGDLVPGRVEFKEYNHTLDIGDSLSLKKGLYDLEIEPDNFTAEKIDFEDVNFSENEDLIVKINDDLQIAEAVQGYAVEKAVEFGLAEMTVMARGNNLYKCSDWSRTWQRCNSEFDLVKNIFVNESYTVEFNSTGVAFIESLENITNITYLKVKDDPRYEAIIDSAEVNDDGVLTVIFHHDSPEPLPVSLIGRVKNYTFDKNISSAGENVTLTVPEFNKKKFFRIKIGRRSEVFEFGEPEQFEFNAEIKDSKNRSLDYDLELEDAVTEEKTVSERGRGRKTVDEGIYDIKVRPRNNTIKEIKFDDVEVYSDVGKFVNIEDTNETEKNLSGYAEVYSIDPTGFNFTNATVTVTATGSELYKCKDWNFSLQECYGEWVLFKTGLVAGENYTFVLTADDPGFAESQPNETEGVDCYIREDYPDTAYDSDILLTGDWASGDFNSLIKFNVSNITGTVTSANLTIYTAKSMSDNLDVEVHRATAAWNESATWNTKNGADNWTAAGGDYDASVENNQSIPLTTNTKVVFDVTDLVNGWVNGSYANNGLVLTKGAVNADYTTFHSSSATNTTMRPKLSVATTNVSAADTTPPASVTNLANQSQGTTWIYWNWTEPADGDFNSSIVYLDGVWKANTTNNFYNATGLNAGTSHTLTVHTKDNSGNVNDTDINSTVSTATVTDSCGTLNSDKTLVADVSSSGTCFVINASNIVLDCAGYSINYSRSESGYAIDNTAGHNNVGIKNCNIVQDNSSLQSEAIWIGQADNNDIYNNTITTSNSNADAIYIASSLAASANISGNTIVTEGSSSGAYCIYIQGDSHLVTDNDCTTNQGRGIEIVSSSHSIISRNNITTGGPGVYLSNTNTNNTIEYNVINHTFSFSGIFIYRESNENMIRHNIIYSSNNGIEFDSWTVSLPNDNIIQNNTLFSSSDDLKFIDANMPANIFLNQNIGAYNFDNTTIEINNSAYGSIRFTEGITGSGANLSADIKISNNSAHVNSSKTGLNKSANVTLINLPAFSNPEVKKNGETCSGCTLFSYSDGTAKFSVPSWSNYSIGEGPADTTPPASVTNLANQSQGTTWIYWNWTEPADGDFNSSIVYLDGVWKANTTNNFYNATGLNAGTSYTLTVHTKDNSGNVNDTDVNSTASTTGSPMVATLEHNWVAGDIFVDEIELDPTDNELQIKWDVSFIPNSSVVNDADLCLYITSKQGSPDNDANISRVNNQTWIESISAANYQGLSLTNSSVSSTWSSTTTDTRSCIDVTSLVKEDTGNSYTSFRIEDADYPVTSTATIHNTTVLNSGGGGLMAETHLIFASSEHGTESYRPQLIVNYTGEEDATAPGSAAGLANQSAGETWIYWNWTNPADSDFSQVIVYLDGSNVANTSYNYYNATGLSSGTSYNLTLQTKDIYGNVNSNGVSSTAQTLSSDASAPAWSNNKTSPASPATYSPGQNYQFNITWIDTSGVDTVLFEHNFTGTLTNYSASGNNSNEYYYNYNDLAAGSYVWRSYANDTNAYMNQTDQWGYVINKASTTTNLYLDGAESNATITYGTQSNATATTSVGSVTLYRNGNSVSNPEIVTLGAGTYNYTAINPGDENYSSSSATWFLTINPASDTVDLYLNGNLNQNLSITYGTQSNATGTSTSGTEQLFRDSALVSNPEITTLAAGTYTYKVNSTGNANYTGDSTGLTYYLTVNKAASEVNLLLDGTDGNITVEVGSTVNETGSLTTGENGIELYENGTLVNSGSSPLTNLTTYNTLGTFNVTVKYPASENYSENTETHWITVEDTTAPTWSNNKTNASEATKTQESVYFNITLTDNYQGGYQIFSFYNGTAWANDTAEAWNSGDTLQETRTITAIDDEVVQWYWWFNDSQGNQNQTNTWNFTVADTVPTAPSSVTMSPASVYTDTAVTCTASGSTDADNDAITYYYKFNDTAGILQDWLTNTTFDCDTAGCDRGDTLYCWALASTSDANSTLTSNSTTILNTAPEATNVDIKPDNPVTADDLTCNYTYSDLDNDAESGTTFKWYKDDVLQNLTTKTVASGNTSDGETWHCHVIPSDGTANGSEAHSTSEIIGSTAPSIVTVTDDSSAASPTTTGSDVNFTIDWSDADQPGEQARIYACNSSSINASGCLDGEFCSTTNAATDPASCQYTTLEADNTTVSYWVIVCDDAEECSSIPHPAYTFEVNHQPNLTTNPSINPAIAYTTTNLTGSNGNFSDQDSDSANSHNYKWYKNSLEISGATGTTLGSGNFSKGDSIIFSQQPVDEHSLAGIWYNSSALVIQNSLPAVSSVSITPDPANTTDNLTGSGTYSDADNDAESGSTYRWYKNGVLISGATGTTLGSGNFSKGDQIIFEYTPNDGTANGTAVNSSVLTIANSAPTAPTAAYTGPATAYTDSTLTCTASGSTDADGDGISYYYQFRDSDNSTILQALSTTAIFDCGTAGCDKGDTIYCYAKAYDNVGYSGWGTAATKYIDNSIPTLTNPALNDTSPYRNDTIKCNNGSYSDTDNDNKTADYWQWYRNDNLIAGENNQILDLSNLTIQNGDSIKCAHKVSDGEDNSSWSNSSNTASLCLESWTANYGSCLISDTKLKYYADNNSCGTVFDLPGDNGSYVSCDYIVSTEFGGTNFSAVNLSNIDDLYLTTSFGLINFSETVSINRSLDLNAHVDISSNSITINSTALPELNKSAVLKLYNLSYVNPVILRDGSTCDSSICTEISYSGGNLTFNVTHFTTYSAGEGTYCGDGTCNGGESCSSCAADCGSCGGGSGGGGGGGGGSSRRTVTEENETICQESWSCTQWSECTDGIQTRTCTESNNCNTTVFKPSERKICEAVCEERWACTEWGPCENGNQIRVCKDANDCGNDFNKPQEVRGCAVASCYNGIKDGDETGIDCGGSCEQACKDMISGQSIQLMPETKPNPIFALPAILLIILLVVLVSLKREKMSCTVKKCLTAVHILLIALIALLVMAAFQELIRQYLGIVLDWFALAMVFFGVLAVLFILFWFYRIIKNKNSKKHKVKKNETKKSKNKRKSKSKKK